MHYAINRDKGFLGCGVQTYLLYSLLSILRCIPVLDNFYKTSAPGIKSRMRVYMR
jgi:hypothetical protein